MTKQISPIYVHYYDNGSFNIYNLTKSQYEKLREQWDGDGDDPTDILDITEGGYETGYVTAEMNTLAELCGFEVGTE